MLRKCLSLRNQLDFYTDQQLFLQFIQQLKISRPSPLANVTMHSPISAIAADAALAEFVMAVSKHYNRYVTVSDLSHDATLADLHKFLQSKLACRGPEIGTERYGERSWERKRLMFRVI